MDPSSFDANRLLRETNPQDYAFTDGAFRACTIPRDHHQWNDSLIGWGFEVEPVMVLHKSVYVYQAITYVKRTISYMFIVKHAIGSTDWTIFISDYPSLLSFLSYINDAIT